MHTYASMRLGHDVSFSAGIYTNLRLGHDFGFYTGF
jgi:hypothetical protein